MTTPQLALLFGRVLRLPDGERVELTPMQTRWMGDQAPRVAGALHGAEEGGAGGVGDGDAP